MPLRKILFNFHRILGLITGSIVFIVAITGCCWVFRDEVESLYEDYKFVKPKGEYVVTASMAKDIGTKLYPKNTIHGTLFPGKDQAIEVIFYDRSPEFYRSVFIHPYTGSVIKEVNHLEGFFAFILKGHMRLWLSREIGEQIVGSAIIIYLFVLVFGLILWIPKKWRYIQQRLILNWKSTTRWKRKNFDLHTIIGFYVFPLALIIGFTGTLISYNWMKYIVYKGLGGEKVPAFVIPSSNKIKQESDTFVLDRLIPKLREEIPQAESFEIHYPNTDTSGIYVEVSYAEGIYYNSDYRFYDQYTLQELETDAIYGKYSDAKVADKILRMNYDIHVGAIGGLPGKILAFVISFLIASLPVTGALLWYGRVFKKSKVKKKRHIQASL